jgi:uncharacterized protein (DUF736 family)
MKIKEIQAGVKISKDYNSYSMNLVADLENSDSAESVGEALIRRAEEIINKEINEKISRKDEREVGAAWRSKESPDKLSVQYSKGGKFEDVAISELEEFEGGYQQKINEKVFIFRRIPNEKRKNNKMPMFRIYEKEREIK